MTLQHFDTVFAFVVIITGVSLLVTTMTQAILALLSLRGTNLLWGIKTLLINVDPALENYAEVVAKQILHHPLISDSMLSAWSPKLVGRWTLASAIRKDELVKIIRTLAKSGEVKEGETVEEWRVALRTSLDRLFPGESEKLHIVLPEIKKLFPEDSAKVDLLVSRLTLTTERLTAEVGDWFNSMMDRVSQRFTMHARCWTIVFSTLLAFLLQLDAFKLFTSLSSDAEMRARLVASADALTQRADDILVTTSSNGTALYVQAMKQLIEANPDSLKKLPDPSGFSSLAGGEQWLSEQLKAIQSTETAKWIKAYEAQVPQASLRSAAQNLDFALKNQLSLQLLPNPYPDPIYRDWTPSNRTFWGILASAALLSLGAPFWFNLLKTMSNLRPIIAAKESKERSTRRARTDPELG